MLPQFPAFAMPSQPPPRRRRRRRDPSATAHPPAPTETTIHALGDDLLREILLRLPSLPSLVRAALTCRGFLAAVRSSPAFRRRFRALHPPPLIGFFFGSIDEDVPTFCPIRRRSDPDIAAAVRGADVFLTRLPHHEDPFQWRISECRGGCLLLVSSETKRVAVYNPLTRALDLFPTPQDAICSDFLGLFCHLYFFLLYSDQSPDSFRVVFFCHDNSRVRASIFSPDTREWQNLPWFETATAQPLDNQRWSLYGTQVNGKLYWAQSQQAYLAVFDTATLQFSCTPIYLPEHLKVYKVGGAKDGKLCIVSVDQFTLRTWLWRADASGAEEWMLQNVVPLEGEILQATGISEDELHDRVIDVQAVIDGIVYLSAYEEGDPCWFLSFCLETRKLQKLFGATFSNHARAYPYIMGWPSLLIGNDIDMALESGVQSDVKLG